MEKDSASAMAAGAFEAVRGVFACWAGLTWAYAISMGKWPWEFSRMEWLLGWMGAVVWPALWTMMMSGWWWLWFWVSWLVLPFALWMVRGAILKEWNRWIVAGVLALVAGGLGFGGAMAAASEWPPWRDALPPVVLLSLAAAAVLYGTARDRGWFVRLWRRAIPPPRPDGGGSVGEPAEEAVAVRGGLRR